VRSLCHALRLEVAISLSHHPLDLESYSSPLVAGRKPVDGRRRTAHEPYAGDNPFAKSLEEESQTRTHAQGRNPSSGVQSTATPAATIYFTRVYSQFREGLKNYRVLFGAPDAIETVRQIEGQTDQVYFFASAKRFAIDLWKRNAYGTIQWRCVVCEAVGPGILADTVPCVTPAARVLLHTTGAAQSRLFLAWLAELESAGVDPLQCPSAMFEAAHFRLQGLRADRMPARRLSGLL
jgi:Protein of unknown function (DUF2840)